MGNVPPPHVRRAILAGDHEAHLRMSRNGGLATARKRRQEKVAQEIFAEIDEERQTQEEWERMCQANEHICPVD